MILKSLIVSGLLLASATISYAETKGYLYRKAGDDAFYVDKKHENGVKAIRDGNWTKALSELESCLEFYVKYGREGLLYRDSTRSTIPTDTMVMYDPRYNAVRYSLAVANARVAAELLRGGELPRADSVTGRAMFLVQHVKGADGPDLIDALRDLSSSNRAAGRYPEAEKVARKAVNSADCGLEEHDPVRAIAYLNLGEVYLSQDKLYDAESPLLIAIDVLDSCSARKGDWQQPCRAAAIEARCLLATMYGRSNQTPQMDSLFDEALAHLEAAKKPLNVPQVDSLIEGYVRSVRASDATRAMLIENRLATELARREKEYSSKK